MRRHLSPNECHRLILATQCGRHAIRDRLLLLLMYRHGLRVSEAIGLELSDVDRHAGTLYIHRLKNGLSTEHPMLHEVRDALEDYLAVRPRRTECNALLLSERGRPLSRQQIHNLVRQYGERARLPLPTYPHMLRHACGYALANSGADTRLVQDYLGHRSIQSTVRYTATNHRRFVELWASA